MQILYNIYSKKGPQDHIKIMKENMNITNEDSAISMQQKFICFNFMHIFLKGVNISLQHGHW